MISLTSREAQILRMVAEGVDVRQIASNLVVSPGTVSIHLDSISGKLSANRDHIGLTQKVQVQEGGHIEATLPQVKAGEIVEVTVSLPIPLRPLGTLKGKIHIHDNFDDPLEELAPYM